MNSNVLTTSRPKVGLALSGGSALGNVHIGVLEAFLDHGIPVDYISGTSAGAVVAACFAFGVPVQDMISKAQGLNWFKLSAFPHSRMGLISTQNVGLLIDELVGKKANIEDAKIPLAIVATNIENGKPVVFTKGSVAKAVSASICIPGLFVPVEVDGCQLVDGAVTDNLPLSPLKDLGADITIAVNLARWRKYRKPGNLLDVMQNAMDIMTHSLTNHRAQEAQVIIEPHLEDFTASDYKRSAELIAVGYRAATLAIPQIKNLLQLQAKSDGPTKRHGPWHRLVKLLKR